MEFVAAIALICSVALPQGTCIVSNAEQAFYANVPRSFCVPAMQQLVAERTRARPLDLNQEYIAIVCTHDLVRGTGLTAGDVGKVAPAQSHTFTAEEVRRMNAQ